MLQRGADLYRLASPVHRGQSASNRKCVYKWGSYFYCFCHLTRSTISLFLSLYLTLLPIWNVLLLFLTLLSSTCFCSLITWKQKQKLVFRSFSPTSPGFQDSRSPLGNLLPWFPHCRTLCPRDSSWPPHCPTEIQLSSNLPQTSSYSTLIGLPWTGLERMVVLGRSRKGKVVWIAWLTSHSKVTLCSQIIVCINFEFRLNYNLDALVSFYNWNWLFIKVIMDHFAFITHSCSLFLLHYCFSWFLHS